MNHIHLNETESTQEYLKKNFESLIKTHSDILITCDKQLQGYGRNNSSWKHLENSLAISCTIDPFEIRTLTSIKVAVDIIDFFDLSLNVKWPNDIYINKKKSAGIIIQSLNNQTYALGLGANIGQHQDTEYGFLFNKKYSINELKEMAKKLYEFILSRNNISSEYILNRWKEKCLHLNKDVILRENEKETKGEFLGIGNSGQALININGKTVEFYSGSLDISII